jgi:hypothetical protein
MDRVYGGALVTLVAASGTHANAGLQGVQRDDESTERSIHQESAEIQGTHLLAPLTGRSKSDCSRAVSSPSPITNWSGTATP